MDACHGRLRLPDSKTGHKIVHMGLPALKVIEAIAEGPGNPYLLVGNWNVGHFVNLQRPWERIRSAAGLRDVRLHHRRHAFASLCHTRWLDTEAAANYVGISIPTLHAYRWARTGPPSRKIGRRVVYAQPDLDAWVAGRAPAPDIKVEA